MNSLGRGLQNDTTQNMFVLDAVISDKRFFKLIFYSAWNAIL